MSQQNKPEQSTQPDTRQDVKRNSEGLIQVYKIILDYKQRSRLENQLEWALSFGTNCSHIIKPNRLVQDSANLCSFVLQFASNLTTVHFSAKLKSNEMHDQKFWYNQEWAP